MMKFFSLSFVLFIFSMLHSQELIIIEDPIFGGQPVNITDTVITSAPDWNCIGSVNYYIDLDNDTNNDVAINLYCYWGGNGETNYIKFSSFGEYKTQVDTNFITTFQDWDFENDTIMEWEDTYTIVKPYYIGDTLNVNQEIRTEPTGISEYGWGQDSPIPITYINIDDFIGDTIYVAFRKGETFEILYYMKIYLETRYTIHVIAAWTNDPSVGILSQDSGELKVINIEYFDMYGRKILKPKNGFYIERKKTNKGIFSKKYYVF